MIKLNTTRHTPKNFAWSYSKLKNYETCPKRYFHIDIEKSVKEEEGESLLYGNAVHKALASAISGKEQLPAPFAKLQKWVDKVVGDKSVPSKILVEQQLAVTQALTSTGWFDADVWYRGIADVLKIMGPVALAIDWKTGKILEDGVQLALMAQCIFAHHPEVQKIRTEFVWLKEDATSRVDFTRADMVGVWAGVLPRVTMLENAAKAVLYPPKPGGLCKRFCPVSACPHQGI